MNFLPLWLTKYHKLGDLKQNPLFHISLGKKFEIKGQQSHAASEICREEFFLASS
jgi:hypothetical protein